MLIEDLLLIALSLCVVFFVIIPSVISFNKRRKQDPLLAAKHRVELAEKEYETALLNKRAFDLIDKSLEEEFPIAEPNKKEVPITKEKVEKTL